SCSTYVIRELQFKTTEINTVHLLKWLKSKTTVTPSAGEDVEQQNLSFNAGRNAKWYRHFGRYFGSFLIKLNILLPYNSAVIFLGIYSKGLKTYDHTKTFSCMFMIVLFKITKIWEQPSCLSIGEWINKLWYIQTMEYYLTTKK
uniref:Uncharacterized protein n=1 Tax=Canis lupus familiaris TaxID=9615 RepID=A0A8P0TJC8_CANLF